MATLAVIVLASMAVVAQRPVPRPTSPTTPSKPQRVERAAPFRVGETLTYDVSWAGNFVAGSLVSTVKEKKPSYNSTAYYIVAEGRPTPLLSKLYALYYKVDTLIDIYTLLSQRGSIYSEEGARHQLRTTLFDRDVKKASFEVQAERTARSEFPIPPNIQDALAALYVARALPMQPGGRTTIPVSDSGLTYRVAFDVGAAERVKVPFGEVGASKVKIAISDPKNQPVGGNLAIWLTEDARRFPVKLEGELPVGSFVLSLRDAH